MSLTKTFDQDLQALAPFGQRGSAPSRVVDIDTALTLRARERRSAERRERAMKHRIEALEARLAEADLRSRETDHRVKNSLALISSLLNVQAHAEADPQIRGALARAGRRVSTVASVHGRLYAGQGAGDLDVGAYLEGLCGDLESSVGAGFGIRVVTACDSLVLDAQQVTAIGLIVSELVTNAVRHAFDEEGGRIGVRLRRRGETGFVLTVEDTGRGLPQGFDLSNGRSLPSKSPVSNGLGMRVVTSYASGYGWNLEAKSAGGARFVITTA